MTKYDLDQIAKEFRANVAKVDDNGDPFVALQLRGAELELAFMLWSISESNRGEVDACTMSKAIGCVIASCLINYVRDLSEVDAIHQLGHVFKQIEDCMGGNASKRLIPVANLVETPIN